MAHTPEPFLIHGPTDGTGPMDDGGDFAIYVERDNTKHIIAEVISKTRDNNREPAEDNARLFAASGDLLDFAVQIFNGIDTQMIRMKTPADETLANVLRRGRAAIAKAKGESQ